MPITERVPPMKVGKPMLRPELPAVNDVLLVEDILAEHAYLVIDFLRLVVPSHREVAQSVAVLCQLVGAEGCLGRSIVVVE